MTRWTPYPQTASCVTFRPTMPSSGLDPGPRRSDPCSWLRHCRVASCSAEWAAPRPARAQLAVLGCSSSVPGRRLARFTPTTPERGAAHSALRLRSARGSRACRRFRRRHPGLDPGSRSSLPRPRPRIVAFGSSGSGDVEQTDHPSRPTTRQESEIDYGVAATRRGSHREHRRVVTTLTSISGWSEVAPRRVHPTDRAGCRHEVSRQRATGQDRTPAWAQPCPPPGRSARSGAGARGVARNGPVHGAPGRRRPDARPGRGRRRAGAVRRPDAGETAGDAADAVRLSGAGAACGLGQRRRAGRRTAAGAADPRSRAARGER